MSYISTQYGHKPDNPASSKTPHTCIALQDVKVGRFCWGFVCIQTGEPLHSLYTYISHLSSTFLK